QAEDGIRDKLVTGVQTCALPIWIPKGAGPLWGKILEVGGCARWFKKPTRGPVNPCDLRLAKRVVRATATLAAPASRTIKYTRRRSEERRVGKECRTGLAR